MMPDNFFRVPDATVGLRVSATPYESINYNSGTIAFVVGDTVTDPTTGRAGVVVHVEGTVVSGQLTVVVSVDGSGKFAQGNALEVMSVQYASVAADSFAVHVQDTLVVGANDPENRQFVDNKGQAYMRFAEGAPQLDAFGKMQVSEQTTLGEYIYSYNTLAGLFSDLSVGGGTLSHEPDTKGIVLSCGTASGDKIQRTSHKYHVYQAGFSQLLEFTGALGDAGKTNVIRRMGYYDDDNGVFFEMNETTFNLVLRSSSTGAVVETRIPQANWNGDKVDGSGLSGVTLDPTKDNIFWIDLQWLGAGTVRYGVMVGGQRIVIHSIHNENTNPHSYMTTGSLPVRYEQENIGVAASTSEMRIFCSTVKTEGAFNPRKVPHSESHVKSVTGLTATPIMSIRATQTYFGLDNRLNVYPKDVSFYNGTDKPVILELYHGTASMTDGTFNAKGGSSGVEVNKDGTAFTGGESGWSDVVGPGQRAELNINAWTDNREGLRRKADITANPAELIVTARLSEAGTGGNVVASFDWDEISS